ncbi:MAG: GNAT family N-acetyltransferase [Salinisphaera sp.]|jgi:GNAT superfamily N-acetyltransferase|nr:GNAT family N-acetyltransferase [Salinisphaera sp.]
MSSFRLQAAADAAALARLSELAHVIWHEHYLPIIGSAQVEYMLADGYSVAALIHAHRAGAQFTLAVDGAIDIGYASLSPDASDPANAWLDKLYVHADARGRGVARALLWHACDQARSLGAEQLWLRVNRHNAGSIGAYQRMGLVIARADIKDIGHGYVMDDYLMSASLDAMSRLQA